MYSYLYTIICKNGDSYFGSTKNITTRFRAHKNCLRRRAHDNSRLQNCWNKYGEDAFIFRVLTKVPTDLQYTKEQELLDLVYDKKWCLNLSKDATRPNSPTRSVKVTYANGDTKIFPSTDSFGQYLGNTTGNACRFILKGKRPITQKMKDLNIIKAEYAASNCEEEC